MRLRIFAAFVLALVLLFLLGRGGSADQRIINGQVFIVAKTGEAFKLPLVHVKLYSLEQVNEVKKQADQYKSQNGGFEKEITVQRDDIQSYITQLTNIKVNAATINSPKYKDLVADMARAKSAYWDLVGKIFYADTADYYLKQLPTPSSDTETDADGRFALPIPRTGEWVLSADAEREVDHKTERYFWLFRVRPSALPKGSEVLLSNENLATVKDSKSNVVSILDESQIAEESAARYSLTPR